MPPGSSLVSRSAGADMWVQVHNVALTIAGVTGGMWVVFGVAYAIREKLRGRRHP